MDLREGNDKSGGVLVKEKQELYATGIWIEQIIENQNRNKKTYPFIIIDESKALYQYILKKHDEYKVYYLNPATDDKEALKRIIKYTNGKFLMIQNTCTNAERIQENPANVSLESEISKMMGLLKTVIRTHPVDASLYYVYSDENAFLEEIGSAFCAMGQCLALEHNNIHFKGIGILNENKDDIWNRIESAIQKEWDSDDSGREVRYHQEKRFVKKYVTVPQKAPCAETAFRQSGVYILTGGAGGIGYIIAEYLAKQYHANLVLSGRKSINWDINQKLERLNELGGSATYISADAGNKDDVDNLIHKAKEIYGAINGIIHCAGILQDGYFVLKKESAFLEVVKPKVLGATYLSQAIQDEPIDFMVLFSSITSVIGNAGQTDYAFGNAFLDEFARKRNQCVKEKKCFGKTISINWTFWKNGNMNLSKEVVDVMEESMGILPMDSQEGIQLLEKTVLCDSSQVFAAIGDRNKMMQFFGIEDIEEGDIEHMKNGKSNDVRGSMEEWLVKVVSKVTKYSEEDIDIDDPLINYGLDSLMIGKLNEELTKKIGPVSSTLFYEYDTLSELADYLESEYSSAFICENPKENMKQDVEEKIIEDVEEQPDESSILARLFEYLQEVIAKATGYDADDIDIKDSFDNFGLDSAIIGTINHELSQTFDSLSGTLLYEYTTVEELGQYFYENFQEKVIAAFSNESERKKSDKEPAKEIMDSPEPFMEWDDVEFIEPEAEMFKTAAENEDDAVAIIGMSGRFPEAENLQEFYQNLIQGKDCVTDIPEERWNMNQYMKKDNDIIKWGGFISDADKFDPLFFHISPVQALIMDPQERLLLQEVEHAIEDAGLTKKTMKESRTGVYVGAMYYHYQLIGVEETLRGNVIAPSPSSASIANRISYHLDFHGPSITFDTMCSSALTALHYACEGILNHDIDMAVAGGVNLSIHPSKYLFLNQANFLASDGRCRSFGEGGDGYVPGEGVGAVILKSFKSAIKENDQIYGVIRSSVLNHGGKTSGYTVPSPVYQGNAIEESLEKAKINPRTISCIEAHGTGTSMGDPIEITGLVRAFGKYTDDRQFCSIGSVKSNIGHLESASGIASLIKVLLEMKHHQLFPSIHGEPCNSKITFSDTPFYLQTETEEWKRPVILENGEKKEYPRIAGISSFGAGGSNAHVIVEEFVNEQKDRTEKQEKNVFVLSAQNKERLKEYVEEFVTFLDEISMSAGNMTVNEVSSIGETMKQALCKVIETGIDNIDVNDSIMEYVTDPVMMEKVIKTFCASYSIQVPEDSSSYYEDSMMALAQKLYSAAAGSLRKPDNQKKSYGSLTLTDLVYTLQCRRESMEERMAVCVSSLEELHAKLHAYLQGAGKEQGIFTGNSSEAKKLRKQFMKEAETPQFIYRMKEADNFDKLCYYWVSGVDLDWDQLYDEKRVPVSLPLYPFAKERYWITDLDKISDEDRLKHHPFLDKVQVQNVLDSGITLKKLIACNDIGVSYSKETKNSVFSDTSLIEMVYAMIRRVLGTEHFYLRDLQFEGKTVFEQKTYLTMSVMLRSNQIEFKVIQEDKKVILQGIVVELLEKLELGQLDEDSVQDEKNVIRYALSSRGSQRWNQYFCNPAVLGDMVERIAEDSEKGQGLLEIKGISRYELAGPIPQNGVIHLVQEEEIYNAFICNEQGQVFAMLQGIAVSENTDQAEDVLYEAKWECEEGGSFRTADELSNILILYTEAGKELAEELKLQHRKDRVECMELDTFLNHPNVTEEVNVFYFLGISDITSDVTEMNKVQKDGIDGFLKVLQKMGQLKQLHRGLCIKVISNNVYQLNDEGWNPLNAGMNGMLRSAVKEYDGVSGAYMDIDIREDKRVIAEFLQNEDGSRRPSDILVRNGKRYIKKLYPSTMKYSSQKAFRKNGVYVIFGGMGTIGKKFAAYLLEKYQATVYLVGRSPLDDRKAEYLNELARLGGKPEYYAADISNESNVIELFQKIIKSSGIIHGVIHSAANFKECAISELTDEKFRRERKSKMEGVVTLQKVLQGYALDFMLFFSSGQSFIANANRASYAAASCFEDAYALYLAEQESYPVQVINWGFWGAQEGYDQQEFKKMLDDEGVIVLSDKQKMQIIESVVSNNEKQVFILNVNEYTKKMIGVSVSGERKAVKSITYSTERKNQEKTVKRVRKNKKSMKETLVEIFSEVLMIPKDKLGSDIPFADFGVDSILIGDLISKLDEKMKIVIDPTVIMDNDTLDKLAEYLEDEYQTSYEEEAIETEENVYEEKVYKEKVYETKEVSVLNRTVPSKKIAVVGMGCHFPGSSNRKEFWDNLKNGVDSITEVPKSRWDSNALYASEYEKGKSISKWGGFIDNIEMFDPEYFNFSPESAKEIDPLVRQVLEVTTDALRDAGYTNKEVYGSNMGVYIGSRSGLYGSRITQPTKTTILGIGQNFIAAHLSHFYNFTGPSYVLDSACSSSLLSIHNAVNGILSGDCEMALAGGADILLDETPYMILSESRALSPKGKCYTFDEKADGFVPGEGCGVVLLKPLDKAIADGNKIYAVIEASAINNDGHTMGITTPNPKAQAEVIEKAMQKAGVTTDTIGYVETHGTATLIGDPIELKALDSVFKKGTDEKGFCGVGSVKTNFGHLLSAAGIASFSKVCLMLYEKQIVPTLNCTSPNPRFHFSESPFYIADKLKQFEKQNGVRRAGISSFGFGGTNVHVIVSEPEIYLPDGYQPTRESLPPEVFHKQYYWMEKEKRSGETKKSDDFDSFLNFHFVD